MKVGGDEDSEEEDEASGSVEAVGWEDERRKDRCVAMGKKRTGARWLGGDGGGDGGSSDSGMQINCLCWRREVRWHKASGQATSATA